LTLSNNPEERAMEQQSLNESTTSLSSREPHVALVGEATSIEVDELRHQVLRHREDLKSIDTQIARLEETIDLEQQQLREAREALAEKNRLRARLLLVRSAMSKFVQGLQSRE
jgi:predicted  nucleic acid-binding Zn-ribbon protein